MWFLFLKKATCQNMINFVVKPVKSHLKKIKTTTKKQKLKAQFHYWFCFVTFLFYVTIVEMAVAFITQ